MYKKFIFLIILTFFSLKSYALVEFKLKENKYIRSVLVEGDYSILESKNKDFFILFNSKKEMFYLKHKNLKDTFKISLAQIELKKNRSRLKEGNSKLNLLSYKTNQTYISGSRSQCLEVHGSKDLYSSLNIGFSSIFNLYKIFNQITGQVKMKNVCQNLIVDDYYNEIIGFPLAIFYGDKSVEFEKLINKKYSLNDFMTLNSIDEKKSKIMNLEIKTEIILSLLDKKQRSLFNKKFSDLNPVYKIRAAQNFLNLH